MNLIDFHQQISPIIIQRGKDYYNEGAVINLEAGENGLFSADVEDQTFMLWRFTSGTMVKSMHSFVIVRMIQMFANTSLLSFTN